MIRIAEAIIDEHGTIRLLEPVRVAGSRRTLVTILDKEPAAPALPSQRALAEDWNRPEEDATWSHLQPDRSGKKRVVTSAMISRTAHAVSTSRLQS